MAYLLFNEAFKKHELFSSNIFKDSNEVLHKLLINDKISNTILIVPTKRIVRYLEKKIIIEYYKIHKKPLRKLQIYNLEDFAKELFKILQTEIQSKNQIKTNIENSNPIFVSEALRLVLTEEAFSNSNLEYYKFPKAKVRLEVIHKLSELIYGLREDGFSAEEAKKELESKLSDKFEIIDSRKNSDTLKLIIEYEKLLEANLFDSPKMYKILNKYISNYKNYLLDNLIRTTFGENSSIIVTGFSEFRQPEFEFLSNFNRTKVPIGIFLDYSDSNGPLFGNFQEVINKLIQSGYQIFSDEEIFEKFNQDNLDIDSFFLRKYLFNYHSDRINQNFDKYINIIQVMNIEDEVLTIAKLVKHLNLKKGINFEDIAIVSRRPEDYSDSFRDIFRKEKIPVNISDRKNLMTSGIINTILTLLDISLNFDIDLIHKVVSSKFISLSQEIDIDNILKVSKVLRIRSFYYKTQSKYIADKAKHYLSFVTERLKDKNLEYHDKGKYQVLSKELEKFIAHFSILIQLFPQEKKEFTAKEFRSFVIKLVEDYKIISSLKSKMTGFLKINTSVNQYEYLLKLEEIERENKALEKLLELCNNLSETFSLRFKDNKVNLKSWIERLRIAVSSERYQVKEKVNYGVTITSIEQIRMLPFKVKILCGMNDGSFPTVYAGEQILGRELKDSRKRHIRSERVLFYQFLSNSNNFLDLPQQEIYLFYYLMKNGEMQSPSPFIENLLKISNLQDSGNVINTNEIKNNLNLLKNDRFIWLNSISQKNELIHLNLIEKAKLKQKYEATELYKLSQSYLDQLNFQFLTEITLSPEHIEKININEEKLELIRNHFFSISEIETYAKCPFKYFISKILKIDAPDNIDESLTSLEKGTFIHSVLYQFYSFLLNNGLDIKLINISKDDSYSNNLRAIELNPNKQREYEKILLEIIKNELLNPIYDHPFINLETRNYVNTQKNKNHLLNWLDNELQKISLGWDFFPFAFEYDVFSFIEKKDKSDNVFDTMKFHIKADKVEIKNENGNNFIGVVDYKLSINSIVPNKKIIKEFKSFQMPLYLAVLSNDFKGKNIDVVPIYGMYNYLIPKLSEKNEKYQKFVLLSDIEHIPNGIRPSLRANSQVLKFLTTAEAIRNSVDIVFEIRDKMLNGEFPLSNNFEEDCVFCNYDSVCRRRLIG
jgi:ATP-dependent helicase/nuclease subunit B